MFLIDSVPIQQCCLTTSKQRKMCKMFKNFSVMLFLSASKCSGTQWSRHRLMDRLFLVLNIVSSFVFFSAQHLLLILFIPRPSPSASPPPPCLKTPPPVYSQVIYHQHRMYSNSNKQSTIFIPFIKFQQVQHTVLNFKCQIPGIIFLEICKVEGQQAPRRAQIDGLAWG